MSVDWTTYLQAEDMNEVQQAALGLKQKQVETHDSQIRADLEVASRMYILRGEFEHAGQHNNPQAALAGVRALLGERELLDECSPSWHSRVHQLHGRLFLSLGDYAGGADCFERAARIREEAYNGSDMAVYLYNSASSAALLAGAEEWAAEMALCSLKHLEKHSWMLDDPQGIKRRKEAARCLNQALGLEPHGIRRSRLFRRK